MSRKIISQELPLSTSIQIFTTSRWHHVFMLEKGLDEKLTGLRLHAELTNWTEMLSVLRRDERIGYDGARYERARCVWEFCRDDRDLLAQPKKNEEVSQ